MISIPLSVAMSDEWPTDVDIFFRKTTIFVNSVTVLLFRIKWLRGSFFFGYYFFFINNIMKFTNNVHVSMH